MVVQCPTCQSKFRIADEKVTDKGVRVRCTGCKNVFQVRKQGAAGEAPGPGSTVEMSPLDAAALAKPKTGPIAGRTAAKPPPFPPPPPKGAGNGAPKLNADDLFGMAELTGDAPLGDVARPKTGPIANRPKTGPITGKISKPPPQPVPSFDDIDLEVADEPARPAVRSIPPPDPQPDRGNLPPPSPPPFDAAPAPQPNGSAKVDPFDDLSIAASPEPSLETVTPAKRMPTGPISKPSTGPIGQGSKPSTGPIGRSSRPPEPPPGSASRDLVSSALTGLLGAALAIFVVFAAALNEDGSSPWFGAGPGSADVVATRVVSGLYDTAAGKPVFYVRGRVENRGGKTHGPVRVVAELVGESGALSRAEALAGAEPTPEDVWSLHSAAEAEKLVRTLDANPVERRVQPGASLPFFAVIPDPPQDLQTHRLRLHVETVDAWVPSTQKPKKR